MRLVYMTTIFFLGCGAINEISFRGIKDGSVYHFDNSVSLNQFIDIADSLKCDGHRIVGNVENSTKDDYVIISRCKSLGKDKIIYDGEMELPIYSCDGYWDYGINLCEDTNLNVSKLREFYLNPQKKADYPSSPRFAKVKIVAEESLTIESLIPAIRMIKSLRDQLGNKSLSSMPFIFTLQTIQRDSMVVAPPETIH